MLLVTWVIVFAGVVSVAIVVSWILWTCFDVILLIYRGRRSYKILTLSKINPWRQHDDEGLRIDPSIKILRFIGLSALVLFAELWHYNLKTVQQSQTRGFSEIVGIKALSSVRIISSASFTDSEGSCYWIHFKIAPKDFSSIVSQAPYKGGGTTVASKLDVTSVDTPPNWWQPKKLTGIVKEYVWIDVNPTDLRKIFYANSTGDVYVSEMLGND